MSDERTDPTSDGPLEWNDEERRALEELPRDVDPGPLLEERTVTALKQRGLLRGRPGRPRLHPAWWAAVAAAAIAVFLAGMTVGHTRGARSVGELMVAMRSGDAAEQAALVQRTGSLYVEALAGLAGLQANGNDEAVSTGTEVARAALAAATLELARLHPDDARWSRILDALGAMPGSGEMDGRGTGEGSPVRQVLWF